MFKRKWALVNTMVSNKPPIGELIMAPFFALLVAYAVARAWTGVRYQSDPGIRAARVALAAMFVLTGVAHFVSTEAMVQMLPPFMPGRVTAVYVTGVIELIAAALLLSRVARPMPWLGWALAAFLLALLPANIYSAVAQVGLGGHGTAYLWFRVPLQLFFIGWALMATGALQSRTSAVAVA
ncbi:MAG: hypothetical protein AAF358_05480 [Pseudomonadota bacterium]